MFTGTPRRSPASVASHRSAVECIDGCLEAAKGAISDNTERALRADLVIYAAWCRERGLAALPASPATVAAFVDDMGGMRAPATVRRYVARPCSSRSSGCTAPGDVDRGRCAG